MDTGRAPEHIAELKRRLGRRLADLRQAAEVTQQDVARHTFLDRSYVSHAERGQQMPERAFWVAADDYLQAEGQLCAAYDELAAAQHAVKQDRLDALRNRHLRPSRPTALHDAEVLRRELAETFGLLTGHGHAAPARPDLPLTAAHTVQVMEAFSGHDLISRRNVLLQLSVLSGEALLRPVRQWIGLLPVMPVNGRVNASELDELDEAVKLFRRWDAAGVGSLKRKAVVGQLRAVAETVAEARDTETTRRLFHILAEFAQLAGWMSYDQGFHGAAQRYYLIALHACREASAAALAAKIIGDMMQLSTALGHYDDSLNLARAGLYTLPRNESAPVRAELLGLEARAYAQTDNRDCAAAVRSAESCLSVWHERDNDPLPDWQHYLNQAEIDCLAANAYTQLALTATARSQWQHFAEQAERHTLAARQARSDHYGRSRVVDEVRLARVRLGQREPVEAVNVATQAMAMTGQISSSIVCDWLIRFHRELNARHPELPATADLTVQLRDHLRQTAPARERELLG